MEDSYNGWKNYETWNVSLWICNDEGLYNEARRFRRLGYEAFAKHMNEMGLQGIKGSGVTARIYYQTPDGVAWNDSGLDIEALDAMIGDL